MRATRFIWTVVSFIVAVITVIVIMRFFGVSFGEITETLAEGLEYVGKMLGILKNTSAF